MICFFDLLTYGRTRQLLIILVCLSSLFIFNGREKNFVFPEYEVVHSLANVILLLYSRCLLALWISYDMNLHRPSRSPHLSLSDIIAMIGPFYAPNFLLRSILALNLYHMPFISGLRIFLKVLEHFCKNSPPEAEPQLMPDKTFPMHPTTENVPLFAQLATRTHRIDPTTGNDPLLTPLAIRPHGITRSSVIFNNLEHEVQRAREKSAGKKRGPETPKKSGSSSRSTKKVKAKSSSSNK